MQSLTHAEEWILDRIKSGEIADFNLKAGRRLDPTKRDVWGWGDERTVSRKFLRYVFSDNTIDIPFEGVRINGAFFPEGIALEEGRLQRAL